MRIISLIVILLGVILIYDARTITKKMFGFGDQNEGTAVLKILGVLIVFIGALILYLNR
jgi:ABC-type nickel/cobalt efflux system permease component RcnA